MLNFQAQEQVFTITRRIGPVAGGVFPVVLSFQNQSLDGGFMLAELFFFGRSSEIIVSCAQLLQALPVSPGILARPVEIGQSPQQHFPHGGES